MRAPPRKIDSARVLRFAVIDAAVRPTGATKHSVGAFVDGAVVAGSPLGPFAALAIVKYADDSGYYLFYLDEAWNQITDTLHDSLEAAMRQAEFEYDGIGEKWIDPA